MQNRVTVTVGGLKYTLLATEDENYVHRVAAYVNDKLKETGKAGGVSQMDCAILTAINIADDRFKEQEASENLRRQIKELLEENSKLKSELSESKREIFKLQQKR
ncbi:MAG: cell division protein ZapA [Clostridiales bacterium]|nr:cell division protein ZapA [Clostridiales bacterium]